MHEHNFDRCNGNEMGRCNDGDDDDDCDDGEGERSVRSGQDAAPKQAGVVVRLPAARHLQEPDLLWELTPGAMTGDDGLPGISDLMVVMEQRGLKGTEARGAVATRSRRGVEERRADWRGWRGFIPFCCQCDSQASCCEFSNAERIGLGRGGLLLLRFRGGL